MPPKVTRAGDRGLLVDLGVVSAAELHAAADNVRAREDVVACIVGQQSLYVIFNDQPSPDALCELVAHPRASALDARVHALEVSFAAAHALDLPEFLAHTGLSTEAFLDRLRAVRLTARYLGFRAGFAYLDGWPAEWRLPRRPTSRNRVPGGSFAIAGDMAGFYPVDSPGGWNVLGRTSAILWDPNGEPPNRFEPGDEIEIKPTFAAISPSALPTPPMAASTEVIAEVVASGQLTTIVGARDWDRASHGVPPGGPFDPAAAALVNRAVGDEDDAPLLECVMVGPRLRFRIARRAAWCRGNGEVRVIDIAAGEEIDIGRFHDGLRGYLAIEGGIDEQRARYAEAPAVVKAGATLQSAHTSARKLLPTILARDDRQTIRIILGPHDAPSLPEEWDVTPQLNRVGIRLRRADGATMPTLPADLPSCGMQFGTLQWHPDGSLVAMGPDHPITGGYLQPATIVSDDLWKLAQLAPGDRVRLVAVA